ncbi:MAG: hypothetical protein U1E70_29030 [Acetobacteraceae bacterium]
MPDADTIQSRDQWAATAPPTAASHPEEMTGTVTCSIGNWATFTASGRATPAGLVSAALLLGAIMIPLALRR